MQKPPSVYKQIGVDTPTKSSSTNLPSQGITTPNGSRYYHRIVREKDGKIDVIKGRSNSEERTFVAINPIIFRSNVQAARISNEHFSHFDPRARQPIATVKIGNWVGRAMTIPGQLRPW